MALGSAEFLSKVKRWVGLVTNEQPQRRQLAKRVTVIDVVKVVERRRGVRWAEFCDCHGDWNRELVLYLARQRSGLTLRQIGEALGIAEYKTVGKAVQRFEASLANDAAKRRSVGDCLLDLSLVET